MLDLQPISGWHGLLVSKRKEYVCCLFESGQSEESISYVLIGQSGGPFQMSVENHRFDEICQKFSLRYWPFEEAVEMMRLKAVDEERLAAEMKRMATLFKEADEVEDGVADPFVALADAHEVVHAVDAISAKLPIRNYIELHQLRVQQMQRAAQLELSLLGRVAVADDEALQVFLTYL